MTYYCSDVKKFHDKFGLNTPPYFTIISEDLHQFRVKFFHEELNEFIDSQKLNDLPDAIDALVDLVYITCGCALLHGITPKEFVTRAEVLQSENIYEPRNNNEPYHKPHLLRYIDASELAQHISVAINNYITSWKNKDESGVRDALAEIYVNCMFGSADMGFTEAMWNELWDDVQRANMSKVRATSASESKRGSSFDVIKPKDWCPPKTKEIVNRFIM